eukprot:m.279150 g.279150  ORF g.279150 m.279150 type:complete len:61 (+) comp11103_c3_seq11:336-518(+)
MGLKSLAQLLVSCGAQINYHRDEGRSPLHFAAECGSKSVAQLLIAAEQHRQCASAVRPVD